MNEALSLPRVALKSWQSVVAGISALSGGLALELDMIDLAALLLAVAAGFTIAHLRRHVEVSRAQFERRQLTVRRVARIADAYGALGAKNGLLLISGASGTGKTMLTVQLAEELEKRTGGLRIVRQNDYGFSEADRLREEMQELRNTERVLIVFDQLERLFLLPERAAEHHRLALGEAIEAISRTPKWSGVLVVRREFFLDLATVPTLRPLLGQVMVFGGFDTAVERDAFDRFRRRLVDELGENEALADRILEDASLIHRPGEPAGTPSRGNGRDERLEVLPVEAVAVAEALRYGRDSLGRELSVRNYEAEGGLRGAMRVFFEAVLDGCGNRGDGARILSVLSIEPRARRALSNEEICQITAVPLDRVDHLVGLFERAGLLQRMGSKVDWVHDFFAERFNDLGGVFLDPAERDNIGHFWERLAADGRTALAPHTVPSVLARKYTWVLFVIAVVLLGGRLVGLPLVGRYSDGDTLWSHAPIHIFDELPGTVVDWSFLPIAASLMAWSWYTTALHRRLFSRLGEAPVSTALTYAMTGLSTFLVLLTIVYPRMWITLTGVGGLVVGFKYLQSARHLGSSGMRTELFFGRAGKTTCINCSIMILLGIVYGWFLSKGISKVSDAVIAGVLVATGGILLYYAAVVSSLHISYERVPLLAGIYRRYRKV